jgi:hypothetical protein
MGAFMTSRRFSIRKRLERLEAALPKPATACRTAIVVIGGCDGEHHLVMDCSRPGLFLEAPGPGPQLADFGEFESVLYLTKDEAEL